MQYLIRYACGSLHKNHPKYIFNTKFKIPSLKESAFEESYYGLDTSSNLSPSSLMTIFLVNSFPLFSIVLVSCLLIRTKILLLADCKYVMLGFTTAFIGTDFWKLSGMETENCPSAQYLLYAVMFLRMIHYLLFCT